jgi:hypothetical protein
VEYESERPNRDTDRQCHGDGQDQQRQPAIRPEMSMPPTVLVTELDDGTLILQGRPDGPRTHLSPDDAVPLRRELARAFSRIYLTPCGGQGETS